MGVNYPIVDRVLSSFNDDWLKLFNSIVDLSKPSYREYTRVNGMSYLLSLPIEPVFVEDTYKAFITNEFLVGKVWVKSQGVTFDNGSLEADVRGEFTLILPEEMTFVDIEFIAGFNDFVIPKSRVLDLINKVSIRNLALSANLMGHKLEDLEFRFLEQIPWIYETSIIAFGNNQITSEFKFLPYKDNTFKDVININGKYLDVLTVKGNLITISNDLESGVYNVLVERHMGTYYKSFLLDLSIPEELSEDIPMNFLPQYNDYRLSVLPSVFTSVPANSVTLNLHILGTDYWEIVSHSPELVLSKMSGTGASLLSITVPLNLSLEKRTFVVELKPLHSNKVVDILIEQLEESFSVKYSWEYKVIGPKEHNEYLEILSTVSWVLKKESTSEQFDDSWIEIETTSGVGTGTPVHVPVKILAPSLPYTSLAQSRSANITVSAVEGTMSSKVIGIVQQLDPRYVIGSIPSTVFYLPGKVQLAIESKFEYNISGYIEGTFLAKDMLLGIRKVWDIDYPVNNTGLDKIMSLTVTRKWDNNNRILTIRQQGSQEPPQSMDILVQYKRTELTDKVQFRFIVLAKGSGMYKWTFQFIPAQDAEVSGVWDTSLGDSVVRFSSPIVYTDKIWTYGAFENLWKDIENLRLVNNITGQNVLDESLFNNVKVTFEPNL